MGRAAAVTTRSWLLVLQPAEMDQLREVLRRVVRSEGSGDRPLLEAAFMRRVASPSLLPVEWTGGSTARQHGRRFPRTTSTILFLCNSQLGDTAFSP